MKSAQKKNTIWLIILCLSIPLVALSLFGTKLFSLEEYTIRLPGQEKVIFKSWYLFIGVVLWASQLLAFLGALPRNFLNSSINYVGIIVSLLLLLYSSGSYYAANDLSATVQLSVQKLLAIRAVQVEGESDNLFLTIKTGFFDVDRLVTFFHILFFDKNLYKEGQVAVSCFWIINAGN